MMPDTIFYSWQSDLQETRNVIRGALDRAVRNLNRSPDLEEAIRVDQDTDGVVGWPDITASILSKIDQCEVFVADLTPINGPTSDFRLTPNPNVLLELGYALATGLGRLRIICVVNSAYLEDGDLKELPFDVRGSRPMVFSLAAPEKRGSVKGQADVARTEARDALADRLESSLRETLDAIQAERAGRILDVTPHVATENLERFQVLFEVKTTVPFQVSYFVKEPSGSVLSGLMMSPVQVDPKNTPVDDLLNRRFVRFSELTLKPLKQGNDIYVLAGNVAHLPTGENPVPKFHPFEVRYRAVGSRLIEVSRQQPPPH